MAIYRSITSLESNEFRAVYPGSQAGQVVEVDTRVEEAVVLDRLKKRASEVEAATRAELLPRIQELEQAIPETESLLAAVSRARKETVLQARGDIADLVETLTRRIVGDAVRLDKRALLSVVDQAVETVARDEILFLRVPEDAAEVVRAHVHPDVAARVVGEPSLCNSCEVITAEARVETSLEDVLDQLTGLVHDWAANTL